MNNTLMLAEKTRVNDSVKTVVATLLKNCRREPVQLQASAFAPSNIALCKYWGKRDPHLNLPVTASLSLSLGCYGASTQISEWEGEEDYIQVNQQEIETGSPLAAGFKTRLSQFLDLIRPSIQTRYRIETESSVPIAAGLASSASGFAALVLAVDQLYGWNLPREHLSILARLGSGSACRSLWQGFVEWRRGDALDGMDSHGLHLNKPWAALRFGLLLVDQGQKPLSSRWAMQITQETSLFYQLWPEKVNQDFRQLKLAIDTQNFSLLGEAAESNAQAMHALMMTATPSIVYTLPDTLQWMQKVWECRKAGLPVYFTQDAGPNLKLLFLEEQTDEIVRQFPGVQVVAPFLAREV